MDDNKALAEEIPLQPEENDTPVYMQTEPQLTTEQGEEVLQGQIQPEPEPLSDASLAGAVTVKILPSFKDDEGQATHEWFKVDQKVKARTENGSEDELYETLVRDFVADRLYLDIPKINGAFMVPPIGTKIFANFILNNNVYFFQSTLISITRLQDVPVWVLEMPTEFKRIQRRSFLRMDILLPVEIRVETKDGIFMPPVKTNCLDISGGGMRYVLDYPLPPGKLTRVIVNNFPEVGPLEALCKAVRSVQSVYSQNNYWIGAQFVDLPYKLEDKIVRYIFKIQQRVIVSSSAE